MKKDILKIAGVKSEKEFYKKYPTEEAFMAKHGGAFKKAAMGKSMVKKQLTQLTDFSNPPMAQMGAYVGGESAGYQPFNFRETFDNLDYSISGKTNAMRAEEARMARLYAQDEEQGSQNQTESSSSKKSDDMQQKIAIGMKIAGAAAGVPIVKRGGKLPKYQNSGPGIPSGVDSAFGLGQSMDLSGATNPNPYAYQNLNPQAAPQMPTGPGQQQQQQSGKQKSLATTAGGRLLDKGVKALGPLGKPVGQVVNAVRKVTQSIDKAAQARQAGNLAKLSLEASSTRPEETKRRYTRPEDMLTPGGGYGTGTDFLQMQDGGSMIGGNPTEIQNMYNPGNMYSDLGYEPLSDSDKVKQYRKGGALRMAEGGLNIPTNPLFDKIGKTAEVAGDVASGFIDMGTEKRMKQNQQLLGQTAFQQGAQSIQNQYGSFMKDGGGLKYLSHDWQPQVIAKFGEYDLKDLLAPPKDADMLRAGGHLKAYTAPSEEAMSTERPMMQMGGELQTYWGGDAETISENPYLPDGGETVMFRGQSHEESDGQGRTGIGITFGQNPVEVERGEPAVKLKDGGSGEDNLIVFGNMKIPSYGVSELEDSKAKGKKFKHYAADLSKVENKANKTSDKALKIIDDVDGDSPFDILKLNTGKAMLQGADATLKETAYKKNILAGVQNAILDTAEEMGVESDALAKGKIKPAKDSDMAKFGAKMETAQWGKDQPLTPILPVNTYYRIDPRNTGLQTSEAVKEAMKPKAPVTKATAKANAVKKSAAPKEPEYMETRKELVKPISIRQIPDIDTSYQTDIDPKPISIPLVPTKEKKTLLEKGLDAYSDLYSYIKPDIENPLDPGQLAGEMYALATNQLEPVQAQTYMPLLEDATSVSFQDQLNEIQAQANAAMRLTGNNPAAQAMIASQAASAKNKVLAEQFRTNQALQMETRRRNIATLNDATLKNLAILDQQYTRQAQAKSATKAQAFEALSSIAEKIGKNKSETLSANVMANMYPQYSYGPQGRIYSTGTTKFNIPTIGSSTTPTDAKGDDLLPIYDKKGKVTGYKVKESRNGSIVKAIKNL